MNTLGIFLLYLFGAPLLGGLLNGIDRKISARMQSRIGPPIWQPFYDFLKLWEKENIVVRRSQNFYVFFYLLFVIFTGALFFTHGDLLLVIFALTLAGIFLVLGAYKASSPYSFLGAERELLQMMSYEPMVLLIAIGMYMVTGSFQVNIIADSPRLVVLYLPGVFAGFVFILAMKLRKSPFDLSMSHHAHQELVRGLITEFSGQTLAAIELAHWYETVLILSLVFLFFASHPLAAVLLTLLVYFFVILIDNTFARAKWQMTLASCWMVAAILGLGNIVILNLMR